MDFSVGRPTHKSGTISIRQTVEVSEHEAVPFLLANFPRPGEVDRELAALLSLDDFGVSDKDGSTEPGDNPHSRRQDIGPMPSLDSVTTQLYPDERGVLQAACGNGTELILCSSGSPTSLESDTENYHQVFGRSFPNLKYGLSR
ncbi:hypothetical protein FBEOM_14331 [Fusarium beomiforme]|uniref:Uncharacterized protein n=1 Tax=Fusarium beomiforme TaxID=44412 RepID=A0A9P5DR95_9HYPO|nr:hypothetical protein FBEOM_14331 [Fusarium beomiforme]